MTGEFKAKYFTFYSSLAGLLFLPNDAFKVKVGKNAKNLHLCSRMSNTSLEKCLFVGIRLLIGFKHILVSLTHFVGVRESASLCISLLSQFL
jgi:hypothetical protein